MYSHEYFTECRIRRMMKQMARARYGDAVPLKLEYFRTKEPVPFAEIGRHQFRPLAIGRRWGREFDCAWMRVSAAVPRSFRGCEVGLHVLLAGEGCVYDTSGRPIQGLVYNGADEFGNEDWVKGYVPILKRARGGERVTYLIDAAANDYLGAGLDNSFGRGGRGYVARADLAVFRRDVWNVYQDAFFLWNLRNALPASNPRRDRLLYLLNEVCNVWDYDAPSDVVRQCRKILAPELAGRANASALQVSAVGHAHLDVAWLWPLRETVRKMVRTFSSALKLMEEYPEYRFGASQAELFQMIKESHPALYRRVKRAVKAGRIEPQGAMWVETDCNVPSGESLVRQVLYGKRFFKREFGIDVNYGWLPDVFGYSGNLPQILKRAGVDYFLTQKISWCKHTKFPYHTFLWRGIDGSEVLGHFPPATYNARVTPEELLRSAAQFKERDRCRRMVSLFGQGDGGGGPNRHHLERLRRAADHEDLPRVTQEWAAEFLPKLAADARDLPVWVGELHLDIHRGTLTSQARNKRMNRLAEIGLRELEYLHALSGFRRFSSAEIERLWRVVMLNQFHDILPGSSITRVYAESQAQYERLMTEVKRGQDALRKAVFDKIDTSGEGDPVIVTNSLSWEREENVFVAYDRKGMKGAVAPDGGAVPLQPARREDRAGYVIPARVPSMGHAVYHLSGKRVPLNAGRVKVTRRTLENDLVKVAFRPDGTIGRITDRRAGRDVLTGPGNALLLFEDLPSVPEMDAWELDVYYEERPPAQARLVRSRIVARGPLFGAMEFTYDIGNSRIVQTARLDAGSPAVRFDTHVDWREARKLLKARFPVNAHAERANFEIQYGHMTRPTHRNTNWDLAQFEGVGHRWVDLSQPNYGVALLNDCKYGHKVLGNMMEISLLRSPRAPDPKADMGAHEFSYAVYPHCGDLVTGRVVRAGAGFNVPLRAFRVPSHAGRVPGAASNFSVDSDHVHIAGVKKAEDRRAAVVRLYEVHGTDARATLYFGRPVKKACLVDLMEREIRPLRLVGNRVRLALGPFELKSVMVM